MQIGLETSSIITAKPTGIARYAVKLSNALVPLTENRHSLLFLNKLSRLKQRNRLYRHPKIPATFYLSGFSAYFNHIDILHSLDAFMPYWPGTKCITTIHDLFALTTDDELLVPKSFQQRRAHRYKKIKSRSDAIIAVSNNTKMDIVNLLNIPENKIFVTHLGVDEQYRPASATKIQSIKEKYSIAQDYLFYIGRIDNRKNIKRLIQAFKLSNLSNEIQLILAGPISYKGDEAIRLISKLKLNNAIKHIGFIDNDDLAALYSGAKAFVFPTLYEGFGLPVLEAMSCGTPVLGSNTGSIPEICNGHGVLVDPMEEDAIAEGMHKVLATTQEQRMQSQAHARTFTWERCAQETMRIYSMLI